MIRRVFVEDQEKVRTHHTPFSMEDIQSAVQEGRIAERERIIAVLEKMSDTASSTKTKAGTQTVWVIENAIALIRGATK